MLQLRRWQHFGRTCVTRRKTACPSGTPRRACRSGRVLPACELVHIAVSCPDAVACVRVQALEREIEDLAAQHRELEEQYSAMEAERNSLYDNFEATIEAVKRRSEFRNVLLEKKLADLSHDFDTRQATLNEVRALA